MSVAKMIASSRCWRAAGAAWGLARPPQGWARRRRVRTFVPAEQVPMDPRTYAAIEARVGNTWGLTGAQIGATGGIALVCVAAIVGGVGSGQLGGFLVAAGGAVFLA